MTDEQQLRALKEIAAQLNELRWAIRQVRITMIEFEWHLPSATKN